jgi:hypothetical protein
MFHYYIQHGVIFVDPKPSYFAISPKQMVENFLVVEHCKTNMHKGGSWWFVNIIKSKSTPKIIPIWGLKVLGQC